SGILHPMVMTESSGGWSTRLLPIPAAASPTEPYAILTQVACPEVTKCVATGDFTESGSAKGLFAAAQNGSEWTETELNPEGAPYAHGASLSSLACPSSTVCVAVGSAAHGGVAVGLIATDMATKWTLTEAPVPGDYSLFNLFPNVSINALSCPTAGNCAAVGTYPVGELGYSRNALWTDSGGVWSAEPAPTSAEAHGT